MSEYASGDYKEVFEVKGQGWAMLPFGRNPKDFEKYRLTDRLQQRLRLDSLVVVIDAYDSIAPLYGGFLGMVTGISYFSVMLNKDLNQNAMIEIKWEPMSPVQKFAYNSTPRETAQGRWLEVIGHLSHEELLVHPSERVRMYGHGILPKYTLSSTENE